MRSISPSQDSDLSNSSSACTAPDLAAAENKAQNFLSAVPHQLQQQQQQLTQMAAQLPVTMGGGASSQMRAYQNLPSNARIVRGPNGQLSLQKIQTIELTPEMQAVSFLAFSPSMCTVNVGNPNIRFGKPNVFVFGYRTFGFRVIRFVWFVRSH